MKLTWSATGGGHVEKDSGERGSFTARPALSFDFDMVWFEPDTGDCFVGIGYGRRDMTEVERQEITALIPGIVIGT